MMDQVIRRHFGLALVLLFMCGGLASCVNAEDVFTEGRLENICNDTIPACNKQASCILTNEDYYDGNFPGGLTVVARTETDDATMFARFLLIEPVAPGTELQVQIRTPDCSDITEAHLENIDLIEYAGDDLIIEFEIPMPGRGDHMIEVFSDMTSKFYMAFVIEETLD